MSDELDVRGLYERLRTAIEHARSMTDVYDFLEGNASASYLAQVRDERQRAAQAGREQNRLQLAHLNMWPFAEDCMYAVDFEGDRAVVEVSKEKWKGSFRAVREGTQWRLDGFVKWQSFELSEVDDEKSNED